MANVAASKDFVAVTLDDSAVFFDLKYPDSSFVISSPATTSKQTENRCLSLCCAFSPENEYFAFCSNKVLTVVDMTTRKSMSHRPLVRSPSQIRFTPITKDVLLADGAGDVYLFSTLETNKSGKYLLGHCSVLIDVLMTSDEKLIITSERDEKIRVSHYPNCYNILSYCMGHESFVSTIQLLSKAILVSGSGDGTMRFWDITNGKELLKKQVARKNQDKPRYYQPNKFEFSSDSDTDEDDQRCKGEISRIELITELSHTLLFVSQLFCQEIRLYDYKIEDMSITCELVHRVTFPAEVYNMSSFGTHLWVVFNKKEFLQHMVVKDKALGIGLPTSAELLERFNSLRENVGFALMDRFEDKHYLEVMRKNPIDNMTAYLARKRAREAKRQERIKRLRALAH